MGLQKRRNRAAQDARATGNQVTSRADIETEYLERADAPLQKQEFTTKAFNVMWVDFFRMFSALACAASLYVSFKSFRGGDVEIGIFHAISVFVFLSGRSWLGSVDVLLNDPAGLFGPFTTEFQMFMAMVVLQLMVLPTLHLTGHPPTKWSKCFPSGIVFLGVSLAVVAYMRTNLRRTIKYRAELSKKLFDN